MIRVLNGLRLGTRLAGGVLLPLLLLMSQAAAQDLAISGATILTVTDGTIENGTVVVRNGKITAVGQDVPIPAGVPVIDGSGRYVMPGIVDAHSHMAMDRGVNEGSETVTPELIIDMRNDDPQLYRALAGGVTTIHVLHGSANVIGAQNAVIKLRWGHPLEDMYVEGAPRGMKFALGENPKRSTGRYPASRMGIEHTLRWWFNQAREYMKEWDAYEAARRRNPDLVPPRRDLRLEALADVLRGEILTHVHAYRADEMIMMMEVADEFGFTVATFQHGLEGFKITNELAAHGAAVSAFADNWAYKVEAFDAIPHAMYLMWSRGVRVSLNSDSGERTRRMYQEAAKAMKYGGMPEDEALKLITLYAAADVGIDHLVGSIEVGKDGDFAIFNGHPFAPASRVEMTIIDGRVYFDREEAETLEKQLARNAAEREDDR